MSLSSLIVQREIATIRQVEEALARQVLYGADLSTNLLEVAQLPESALVPLLAESMGRLAAPVGRLPAPSDAAKTLVPADLAMRRQIAPLALESDKLVIAVAEPLDPDVLDEIAFALGTAIEERVAPSVRIQELLAILYGAPLDRRTVRLLGRLDGIDTHPGSLPPLMGAAPQVASPPRPDTGRPPAVSHAAVAPMPSVPPAAPALRGAAPSTEHREEHGELANDPQAGPRPPSLHPSLKKTSIGFPAAQLPDPFPFVEEPTERTLLPPSMHLASVARESIAPARRRRGPLTLESATKALEESQDRDSLLDLFFDFSCQFFDYSALFIVRGDLAEGRDAFGSGASRDRVMGVGVPLDMPNILATARKERAPVVTRVGEDEPLQRRLDTALMADLERKAGSPILVVPVVVRQRTVALLVGDGGEAGVDGASHGQVASFAILVGQGFERLIVKKKRGGASSVPPPAGSRGTSKPPRVKVERDVAVDVLERALRSSSSSSEPFSDEPSSRGPVAHATLPSVPAAAGVATAAFSSSPLAGSIPPRFQATARDFHAAFPPDEDSDEGDLFSAIVDLPPPPQVAAVRHPSGPPIPREEPAEELPLSFDLSPSIVRTPGLRTPDLHTPGLQTPGQRAFSDDNARALFQEIGEAAANDVRDEPSPLPQSMAQSVALPPHRPPTPSRIPLDRALPSVIVDMGNEFLRLVERLVADPEDDQAEAELLRQGQHAMPAIMAHFPGPVLVEWEHFDELPPPRVANCGPILRLIARQRRVALPFVLPEAVHTDPDRRFWATYLLTELAYPEAVPAIVARLFDAKERTRRIALLAARTAAEGARHIVLAEIDRVVAESRATKARHLSALETLGEMRDALVVPVLVRALRDGDEDVAMSARRALMVVTRQDFGRDLRRWRAWWGPNATRHRVEWLIDALTHDIPAMRRLAAQELKIVTKEYFGYYDDLPKKERERAQQRYRDWWEAEGRVRFRRL